MTFTKDVAPILFAHCSSCHRAGEIGGFSLLTYEDVRPRARAIARATLTRAMPPWKPEPGYGEFAGVRRLSDAQIDTIRRWVDGGAIEGNAADLPPVPAFPEGWRLGQPDLVIQMREPFTVAAGSRDVLRNFVIPIPVDRPRYVSGLEFRPGNARIVHHANFRIDTTRRSRAMDEADPRPGYDGFMTTASFPEGHFLGWTPGQLPPLAAEGMAWRLDPDTDLVVQLHLQPAERTEEVVQSSIGLFFTDKPPARTPMMLRLGRQHIDIAPGVRDYTIEDSYVLPVDVDVYAVQPHAHFRAREIKGFATLPDATTKWLLFIRDWDFNWQDVYRYASPFTLPKGTTLAMRYTYDNSSLNERNPDRPPKRVRWGQNSSDEMGDLWIQVRARSEEDRKVLYADFGPKVMAEDAVGYEKMLEADPGNGRLHEAVAAIDLQLQRIDTAVAHLEQALRINPASVEAHYNFGTALVWQGRHDDAIGHFQRALQIDPRHTASMVNLGVVLQSRNQLDEAIAYFRRALELAPADAIARANLERALAARGAAQQAPRR